MSKTQRIQALKFQLSNILKIQVKNLSLEQQKQNILIALITEKLINQQSLKIPKQQLYNDLVRNIAENNETQLNLTPMQIKILFEKLLEGYFANYDLIKSCLQDKDEKDVKSEDEMHLLQLIVDRPTIVSSLDNAKYLGQIQPIVFETQTLE